MPALFLSCSPWAHRIGIKKQGGVTGSWFTKVGSGKTAILKDRSKFTVPVYAL